MIERVLTKWVFIYFVRSSCLVYMVYISRTVCCSLDPVLVIRCVIPCDFFFLLANSIALLHLKKRENWVHSGWVECTGVNRC